VISFVSFFVLRTEGFGVKDERRRLHAQAFGEREEQLVARIEPTGFQGANVTRLDARGLRQILDARVTFRADVANCSAQ
jgi:hypothetical protein